MKGMSGRVTSAADAPPPMNSSAPAPAEQPGESHAVFFRQGTWLVLATGVSGALMLATQIVAQRWMDRDEYIVFFALLRFYLLLGIPTIGLQTVFTHQAAAAVTPELQRKLTGASRALLKATLLLWLAVAGLSWLVQPWLLGTLAIPNPAAFWATLGMGLGCLWGPILRGVVQGRQHFVGLGAALIADGAGRFTMVTVILLLGGQAAGGMTGALLGLAGSTGLCAWIIRDVLRGPGAPFAWRPWLRRIVPLTLGAGTVLLFTTVDVMYVRSVFPESTQELYMPAALVGLALMMYAMPLAQVMFPKVARSAALTRRSRAMPLALVATAGGGVLGAIACTLLPEWPLRLVFFSKPAFWAAAPLVPWFAWAMVPLTLANVLINNLLARERFQVVPWLVAVGVAYLLLLFAARTWLPTLEPLLALRLLLALTGVCGILLAAAAAWFTVRDPAPLLETPAV